MTHPNPDNAPAEKLVKLRNESLTMLRKMAEGACQDAIACSRSLGGAVNWADLHCIEARFWQNDSGEQGFMVCIEEASPSAEELRGFISQALSDAGFSDVEVDLEW